MKDRELPRLPCATKTSTPPKPPQTNVPPPRTSRTPLPASSQAMAGRLLLLAQAVGLVERVATRRAEVVAVSVILATVVAVAGASGGGGTTSLIFSPPTRVHPRMNETARTYGGLCESACGRSAPPTCDCTRALPRPLRLSLPASIPLLPPTLSLSANKTHTLSRSLALSLAL